MIKSIRAVEKITLGDFLFEALSHSEFQAEVIPSALPGANIFVVLGDLYGKTAKTVRFDPARIFQSQRELLLAQFVSLMSSVVLSSK